MREASMLVMRHLIGNGTPRGLQDRPATVIAALLVFLGALQRRLVAISAWHPRIAAVRWFRHLSPLPATPQPLPLTPRAVKGIGWLLISHRCRPIVDSTRFQL